MPWNRYSLVPSVAAGLIFALATSSAPAQYRVDTRLDSDLYDFSTDDDLFNDESSGLRYGLDREEDFAADDFDTALNDDEYDPVGFNQDRLGNLNYTTDDPTWDDWYDGRYDTRGIGGDDDGFGLDAEGTIGLEDDEFSVSHDGFSIEDEETDAELEHNFGVED